MYDAREKNSGLDASEALPIADKQAARTRKSRCSDHLEELHIEAHVYEAYGVRIATSVPLGLPPVEGSTDADVTYAYADRKPWSDVEWTAFTETGGSQVFGHIAGDRLHVCLEGEVEFFISDQQIFVWSPAGEVPEHLARIYFLGPAMALWLERHGTIALHGSALALEKRCVAFISDSGGGKSNLAVAGLREGAALVADDIVAMDCAGDKGFEVRSAFPRMRLWPDDIPDTWGRPEDHALVHPSWDKRLVQLDVLRLDQPVQESDDSRSEPTTGPCFRPGRLPLSCIYVPERVDEDILPEDVWVIEPIDPSEKILQLVTNSFVADYVQDLGLQPARLRTFAEVVSAVPIRRLVYRDGRRYLPEVLRAVWADTERALP